MSKILISPYSRAMRNGKKNPKNYCYWKEVVKGLKEKEFTITQLGIEGEEQIPGTDEFLKRKSLEELKQLAKESFTWIAIDNFWVHLMNLISKPGIAIYGKSDPEIFGYKQNENLLKDKKYLRKLQFDMWEAEEYNEEVFVDPQTVIEAVLRIK